MAKKTIFKDGKVNISTTQDFMDSLIYSSCRYFIGRHTIHSHCAAIELAEFLKANPQALSESRKEFLARDIRERINEVLHFASNISVQGQQPEHSLDALCRLVAKLIVGFKECNGCWDEEFFKSHKWTIDVANGSVKCEDWVPGSYNSPLDLRQTIEDLAVWSKLASWLDPTVRISTKPYKDIKFINEPGFMFPALGRYQGDDFETLELHTVPAKTYIENPHSSVRLAPEFITKIQDI